jgi:hypothetical protein
VTVVTAGGPDAKTSATVIKFKHFSLISEGNAFNIKYDL